MSVLLLVFVVGIGGVSGDSGRARLPINTDLSVRPRPKVEWIPARPLTLDEMEAVLEGRMPRIPMIRVPMEDDHRWVWGPKSKGSVQTEEECRRRGR